MQNTKKKKKNGGYKTKKKLCLPSELFTIWEMGDEDHNKNKLCPLTIS